MATIGEIFALIDRLKRNVARNAQDIPGSLSQGVSQLRENFQQDPTGTVLNSANIGGLLGVGMTKPTAGLRGLLAPQEEALQIAQRNAVEMLGLPPNNTPRQRANAMGGINLIHGTGQDFESFLGSMLGKNTRQSGDEVGIFATSKPELANHYANIAAKGGWHNRMNEGTPLNMPLTVFAKKPKRFETASEFYREADKRAALGELGKWRKELLSQGYDSIQVRPDMEEFIVFDPSQVRSRFAAFDPAKKSSSNLLASQLLPGLGLTGLLGLGETNE